MKLFVVRRPTINSLSRSSTVDFIVELKNRADFREPEVANEW